jgi:hypothetical protein
MPPCGHGKDASSSFTIHFEKREQERRNCGGGRWLGVVDKEEASDILRSPGHLKQSIFENICTKKYYLEIMEHVEENSKFLIGTEIRDKVCFLTKF